MRRSRSRIRLSPGETGADGRYRLDGVPVGTYTLVVRKDGFLHRRLPVVVTAGATTTLNVQLEASPIVAVAGDFQSRDHDVPDRERLCGRPVELGGRPAACRRARRRSIWSILNGSGTQPTNAELTTFLDAAAAGGPSVVFAGQKNGTGSIRTLRTATGDPATVTHSFAQQEIYYRPTVEHPIFAGFTVGEPIELMRNPAGGTSNQQYEFFLGYSGTSLAKLGRSREGRRPRRRRRLPLHLADERPRPAREPRRLELR